MIPDTVEDAVYRRLSERIDLFHSALGAMQPILGAAEGVMKDAYAAPRTERRQVLQEALNALDSKHRELERTGIELDDEDPMPMPIYPPTPIDLEDLRTLLTTDLDVNVTHADVASTFDPELASHDAQDRTALVTFGHPDLEHALERVARADVGEPVVRVEKDGVIAWARGDGLKRSRRCPESAQPSTPASTRDDLCARQVEPQQVEPQTVKDSG